MDVPRQAERYRYHAITLADAIAGLTTAKWILEACHALCVARVPHINAAGWSWRDR
jgi:hypothetical protein